MKSQILTGNATLSLNLLVGVVVLLTLQSRMDLSGVLSDCNGRRLTNTPTSPPASIEERRPKLADGCHHVFLDVGANLGVHARFLFEPDKYDKATMAKGWFDDAFGSKRDNRDICVFSFEPNPKHKERLESLAEAYNAMGWRYYPIMAGVSDHEGSLDFVNSRDNLGRGFTARGSGQAQPTGKGKRITVPVKRLASWLLEEIDGRQLPTTVYGKYDKPTVVMKLDIETLEYIVLPDLLLSGALCKVIDQVFGEIHFQFFPLSFEENGLELQQAKEAKLYFMNQLKLMKISRHCHTEWITEDDETHSDDGVPFPQLANHSSSLRAATTV